MRKLLLVITGLVCLFASINVYSHHSFSAEYNVGRPVKLAGTVKKMEWTNPHAWLHLQVTDEQGKVQLWKVEFLGVNALALKGFSSKTVHPGDKLTITGFGARDGSNTANASSVIRTDTGETLYTTVAPGAGR